MDEILVIGIGSSRHRLNYGNGSRKPWVGTEMMMGTASALISPTIDDLIWTDSNPRIVHHTCFRTCTSCPVYKLLEPTKKVP